MFGWKTEDGMKRFFRNAEKSGEMADRMKMGVSVYEAEDYLEFCDGQVAFKREKLSEERIRVQTFLEN